MNRLPLALSDTIRTRHMLGSRSGLPSVLTCATALLAAVTVACAVFLALQPQSAHAACVRQPKIVMIGDSYSVASEKHGVQNPWPERVSKALGIPESRRVIFRRSGYGFAKRGHRFLQLLEGARRDRSVTDVLIVGGAGNDRRCSVKSILKWYGLTVKRLKYLYPNARIMHAITSWDARSERYRKLLIAHIPCYRRAAKRHGVTYLYGCEDVFRKRLDLIGPDNRHPTERGQKVMSARIVKKIRLCNRRYAKPKVKAGGSQPLGRKEGLLLTASTY